MRSLKRRWRRRAWGIIIGGENLAHFTPLPDHRANDLAPVCRKSKPAEAPTAAPKRLSPEEAEKQEVSPEASSVWNRAGTWEERGLTWWFTGRLRELINGMETSIEGSKGTLQVKDVDDCKGEASIVHVRGKLRYGFDLSLTLRWLSYIKQATEEGECTEMEGSVRIAELSRETVSNDEVELSEAKVEDEKDSSSADRELALRAVKSTLRPALMEQFRKIQQEMSDRCGPSC